MKVIDVFPFFNELDLLEIRLNSLDPYVDCFILSEATKTFSGLDKPLYYQENKERFKKFSDKILKLENLALVDLNHKELEFLYLQGLLNKDLIKPLYLS